MSRVGCVNSPGHRKSVSSEAALRSEQRWYRAIDAPSIRIMWIEGVFCMVKRRKIKWEFMKSFRPEV